MDYKFTKFTTMQKGRPGKILPNAHVGFGILVLTSEPVCHWPGQVYLNLMEGHPSQYYSHLVQLNYRVLMIF